MSIWHSIISQGRKIDLCLGFKESAEPQLSRLRKVESISRGTTSCLDRTPYRLNRSIEEEQQWVDRYMIATILSPTLLMISYRWALITEALQSPPNIFNLWAETLRKTLILTSANLGSQKGKEVPFNHFTITTFNRSMKSTLTNSEWQSNPMLREKLLMVSLKNLKWSLELAPSRLIRLIPFKI